MGFLDVLCCGFRTNLGPAPQITPPQPQEEYDPFTPAHAQQHISPYRQAHAQLNNPSPRYPSYEMQSPHQHQAYSPQLQAYSPQLQAYSPQQQMYSSQQQAYSPQHQAYSPQSATYPTYQRSPSMPAYDQGTVSSNGVEPGIQDSWRESMKASESPRPDIVKPGPASEMPG